MKKLLLIFSILLYCLNNYAQTLSGPATMNSGQEYLITVNGESSATYVSYVNYPGTLNTTPNAYNGTVYINNDAITQYSYYQLNAVPANKTTFKFKASSSFPGGPMSVTFVFYVNYSLNNGTSVQQQQQLSFTTTLNPVSTPPPPQSTYYSTAKSGSFTKNDCLTGNTGSVIAYNVPAGKYTSTTSQADADSKAQNDVNTNGQAYANANGTCTPLTPSITGAGSGYRGQEYDFYVNNTSPGDTFQWSVPSNAATITSGQGTNALTVMVANIGGTNPYSYTVSVIITSVNGGTKTLSIVAPSKYCSSCPQ